MTDSGPVPALGAMASRVAADLTTITDLPGFSQRWQSVSQGADYPRADVDTVSCLDGPLETHIVACVAETLEKAAVDPGSVDRLIVASADTTATRFPASAARSLLGGLGLTRCVPQLVSWQQCCSMIVALDQAANLVRSGVASRVVVVGADATPDPVDRVQPFAVFGDAVVSCLVSADDGDLEVGKAAVVVDAAGIQGEDSFKTRHGATTDCIRQVTAGDPAGVGAYERVFPTNQLEPLVVFSAATAGVRRDRLHFTTALRSLGHCGCADPMLNLIDCASAHSDPPGTGYLLFSTAPGFVGALALTRR